MSKSCCYVITFKDEYTMRFHAKSEDDCLDAIQNKPTVASIVASNEPWEEKLRLTAGNE